MSFFKNLFSLNKKANSSNLVSDIGKDNVDLSANFDETRYVPKNIDLEILEGCFKMIESFYIDNKLTPKVAEPINHPINLDQVDREGLGFVFYCRAFQLDEQRAIFFVAYALSDYLIKNFGFKLYKDLNPENSLRGMILKNDDNEKLISIYPFEYSSKVLTEGESFIDLIEKISV